MKLLIVGDFQGKFSEKTFRRIKEEEFDAIIGVGDYAGIDEWRPYIRYMFRQIKKGKEAQNVEEFYGKRKLMSIKRKDDLLARDVLKKLDSLGKPIIFVFGNGDDDWYSYPFSYGIKSQLRVFKLNKKNKIFLRRLKNFKDINYKMKTWRGISFIGFGGYMDIDAYVEDKEFIEQDGIDIVNRRIKRMKKSRELLFKLFKKSSEEKILVLHYPPKGIFDVIRDKKNTMDGKSAGIKGFREAILKFKPRLVLCGHMHEYQGMKKLGKSVVINPGDTGEGKYAIVELPKEKNDRIKIAFRR